MGASAYGEGPSTGDLPALMEFRSKPQGYINLA